MSFTSGPTLLLTTILLGLAWSTDGRADDSQDVIAANFADGESSSKVDGFPGVAGLGWAGPWVILPSKSTLAVTFQPEDTPPHQMATFSLMSQVTDTISAAMTRQLASAYQNFHLDQPYEIRFDFKPIALPVNSGGSYLLYSSPVAAENTGSSDSWIVRSTGSQWLWGNGDKNGHVIIQPSGMMVIPQTVYHFVIKITPSTQSWTCTISNGAQTVTSDSLGFRSGGAISSAYLCFGVELHGIETPASASIGALQIKAATPSEEKH